MRRFLKTRLVLTLAAVLLASGIATASAQDNWVGLRTGYPLGVTFHYGLKNGIANGADLRVSGRVSVYDGITHLGLGVDALHDIYWKMPWVVYIGGGPAFDLGAGDNWVNLHALFGGEYRFVNANLPQLGVFAEGSMGARVGLSGQSARVPTFGLALGVNYHF